MRIFKFLFFSLFIFGKVHATYPDYATKEWWDQFWITSNGWGEPSYQVMSLLDSLDGSKKTITVVDIGAGNGRNSIFALIRLFESRLPKSHFFVHCFDTSKVALQGLLSNHLPDWLQVVAHDVDVNILSSESLPKADLLLLYGILEYVEDKNLSHVFNLASQALNSGGYLVVVALVKGMEALEIEGEITRLAEVYTQRLEEINSIDFIDYPTVNKRPDRHDLGRGYPEDHLHYIYRSVLIKSERSGSVEKLSIEKSEQL